MNLSELPQGLILDALAHYRQFLQWQCRQLPKGRKEIPQMMTDIGFIDAFLSNPDNYTKIVDGVDDTGLPMSSRVMKDFSE